MGFIYLQFLVCLYRVLFCTINATLQVVYIRTTLKLSQENVCARMVSD